MTSFQRCARWLLVAVASLAPAMMAIRVSAEAPAGRPAPKVIRLEAGDTGYQRILGGPPETVAMRSGLVVLGPGKAVGKHDTESYEEIVVVLEGQGQMRITGGENLVIRAGHAAYCPPHTEHDVVNTGAGPLRYVYVVAKVEP